MLANVQQKLNSQFTRLLEEYQTSVGKWLKSDRLKSKMSKVLSISVIFSKFVIGDLKISMKQKLRKVPEHKTRSESHFSTSCLVYGQKFPQNDPSIGNFQVSFTFLDRFLFNFRAFFVSLVGTFEELTAFLCWNWPRNTQKALKQQQSTLID